MTELEMSDTERSLLAVLQEGFPCSRSPYKDMAEKAGIPTEQLLEILGKWKKQGRLRRIGAIINHFEAGLGAGAMVVWQVEAERTEQVGLILAGFKEISHAYERQTKENWPYNLYSMVHAENPVELEQLVKKISRACGVSNYRILVTEKELKKTPPRYIRQ
jgi:DNA-binding Lrp family transcriptional regulator